MDRITVNPRQMGGVPCIRGLRIPIATVVGMIADGMTPDNIVAELPPLELDDVRPRCASLATLSLIARYRFNRPREVPRRPEPITAIAQLLRGQPTRLSTPSNADSSTQTMMYSST